MTLLLLLLLGFGYPFVLWGVGQLMPEKSTGSPVISGDKIIGYENIGQSFTNDNYFWGRPSATGYNAASTGGSNKGPSNPEYLAEVKARIDTFIVHNPDVKKEDIPSDLVTASGGGLDPHISVQGAYIQVSRVARVRNQNPEEIKKLITENIDKPLLNLFGTERVNVLKLNLVLDNLR